MTAPAFLLFGAHGDLALRMLWPSLFRLHCDGSLPEDMALYGVSRTGSTAELHAHLHKALAEELNEGNRHRLAGFLAKTEFVNLDAGKAADYAGLADVLRQAGRHIAISYLSMPPDLFTPIVANLQGAGLIDPRTRVILEKPIGKDLASSRAISDGVAGALAETQTYRIDHYLGKETAQNMMVLRFANAIFEPLWNNKHISQVQITCSENLGMEGGRGGYYDTAGALRDMVQNHLLQLLSLVAMEPPTDLSADGVRDEKVKVIRSLRQWDTPEKVAANVIRAQYSAGHVDGVPVPGYREEDRVNPESKTEAYVAVRLLIDTWRWSGVPFYIRMGKRLPKKSTEIFVHFKDAPCVLFNATCGGTPGGNVLVIRIQHRNAI